MIDLLLIETNSGGDLVFRNGDLVPVTGVENMVYLSLFGGNNFWGNFLMPESQFTSQTETVLKNVTLNSAGRVAIENAVKADIDTWITNIPDTEYSVTVTIPSVDQVRIDININGQQFLFLWNPDKIVYKITT